MPIPGTSGVQGIGNAMCHVPAHVPVMSLNPKQVPIPGTSGVQGHPVCRDILCPGVQGIGTCVVPCVVSLRIRCNGCIPPSFTSGGVSET